jgi:hypothetical protein
VELQPINLGLPLLKELGEKWLVEMAEYLASILTSLSKVLLVLEFWVLLMTWRLNLKILTQTLTQTQTQTPMTQTDCITGFLLYKV